MTIREWHKYFDILCDKFGSPYFSTDEKDLLFNNAIQKYVNQLYGEKNYPITARLQPLVAEVNLTQDSTGKITNTAINAAISPYSYYRILTIAVNGKNTRYIRFNDFNQAQNNTFKKNTICWKLEPDGVQLTPVNTTASATKVSVLRFPKKVSYPSTDPDLPDDTHNEIIAIAVDLAGIGMRDDALAQLNQLNKQ